MIATNAARSSGSVLGVVLNASGSRYFFREPLPVFESDASAWRIALA